MKILAVDTSCDDSAVAILETAPLRLLADEVASHMEQMKRFGGIVPEVASREHLKNLPLVTEAALEKAGLKLEDIDCFAVTAHPGLIGSLLVGVSYIKALAWATKKPFLTVDHIEAHLYSPLLGKAPPFPWIALVVSGGHTELFYVESEQAFRWLGGTLDDAAGEAFDKIGKLCGLDYPAGPVIDRMVKTFSGTPKFTFPVAKTEGLNFSFSGLKTAVSLQVAQYNPLAEETRLEVLAASQKAILDSLSQKLKAALLQFPEAKVVVTGGVACNSALRKILPEAYFPEPRHCSDNAAMIARLAALKLEAPGFQPGAFSVSPQARSPIFN